MNPWIAFVVGGVAFGIPEFIIVGIAAVICPIRAHATSVSTTLLTGLAATALIFPSPSGFIGRSCGGILLALYAAQVVALMSQ